MAAIVLLGATGCQSPPHTAVILGATGDRVSPIEWTADDLAKPIAVVTIRRSEWASYQFVRLASSEVPHIHQRHDLSVTVVSGRVRMHVGGQAFEMRPGDAVDIPHGTVHWAENLNKGGASEAYSIFTPPYDGRDNLPIDRQPTHPSP